MVKLVLNIFKKIVNNGRDASTVYNTIYNPAAFRLNWYSHIIINKIVGISDASNII